MATFSMEDLENLENGETDLENLDFEATDDDFEDETGETETPKAKAPTPYRYGDDAPEPLRGKTAEEAAALFNNLQHFAKTLYQTQNGGTSPGPQNREPDPIPEITEDELLTSNASSVNQKLQQIFESKATPFVHDSYQKLSLLALSEAERNEQAMPYFKKYKGEIVEMAQQLSAQQTADIRTWKYLHDQVMAKHLPEIIEEEVRRRGRPAEDDDEGGEPAQPRTARSRPNAPPASERGTGAGGGGSRTRGQGKKVKLTPEQMQVARGLGIDPAEFAKFVPMFND